MRPIPGTITDPAVDRLLRTGNVPVAKQTYTVELTNEERRLVASALTLAISNALLWDDEIAAVRKLREALR